MKPRTKIFWSLGMLLLALTITILSGWSIERKIILFAVIMAFVGDMCLMTYGLKGGLRKTKFLFLGMVHFAFAHVIYAISFITRLTTFECSNSSIGALIGFVVSCILVAGVLYVIYKSKKPINKRLFKACLAYASIIGLATMSIFMYSFTTNRDFSFIPSLGIVLFFISDCFIAIRELLHIKDQKLQRWIWILYVTGQTLLIIA